MNLDIDGTIIRILQEILKDENTACKDICMGILIYLPGNWGFLNYVSVTLIDKTDPKDPTKREYYWIQTLKTKDPLGLNDEDDLRVLYFVFGVTDYVCGQTVFGQRF